MEGNHEAISIPPKYCQYADSPCDQDFSNIKDKGKFFIYASEPPLISESIERGVGEIRRKIGFSPTYIFHPNISSIQHDKFLYRIADIAG